MNGFDASDEALQAASYQIGVIVDELGTEFATVRSTMDRLLDGGWSGAAAKSFALGWGEWVGGYDDAVSALDAMGRLLAATGHAYGESESASLGGIRLSGAGLA